MSKHKLQLFFMFIVLVADFIAINLAFGISFYERFYAKILPVIYDTPSHVEYIKLSLFFTIITLFFLYSLGLYRRTKIVEKMDELFLIIKACSWSLFFLMAVTFVYRQFSYSRMVFFISWFNTIFFLGVVRSLVEAFILYIERRFALQQRVAIMGIGPMAETICKRISRNRRYGYCFCGYITIKDAPHQDHVIGDRSMLGELIKKHDIDEIILAEQNLSYEHILAIMIECEKYMISFKFVPDLWGMITSKVDVEAFGGITLLGLKESPLFRMGNRIMKRTMDVVGALVGIILFSPFFMVCSILIKATSRGPILYGQERVGEDGKHFIMYKFRTMYQDAEKHTGPVWAKENDPRRTPIGGFMRTYNLDELPQFFNVLKGEMSLVGPRPERPHFVNQFKENIPRYMSRHKIKSGMTGWAQVNGLRGDTSIEERTRYDLYYIENWSLFLDVKIILMSLSPHGMKNAY